MTIDITHFVNDALEAKLAQGLILAGLLSYLAMLGHMAWKRLLGFLFKQITTTVYINGTDVHYEYFKMWLDQNEKIKKCRNLLLSSVSIPGKSSASKNGGMIFSLAPGVHWLWLDTLTRMEFSIEEQKGSARPIEKVRITMFTRSRESIVRMMKEARNKATNDDCIRVYLYAGFWRALQGTSKRYANGYASEGNILETILTDCRQFLSREKYYQDRGLPYRRGYLLTGRPGTGKSTLAAIMATELNLPIYILQIGSIRSDDDLTEAVAAIPRGSILLLEDIDTFSIAQNRLRNTKGTAEEDCGISLSGLLNAIDGITSGNQRILIMTSNHPEKIDPALIRPGRIDMHLEIPPLSQPAVSKYLSVYYQKQSVVGVNENMSITGAELQQVCLSNELEMAIKVINQKYAPSAMGLLHKIA